MPDQPRTDWFNSARFGLFIHWGLYSLLGRGEWAMSREAIPLRRYVTLADRFNPRRYDPRRWAALAAEAGMRYVVLTAKHHEGFCLWNSKVCRFNAVRSAARRDLLAEYVQAFRDAGLKVGLYYSLGDWFNPDWERGASGDQAARERFVGYTHALVEELMSDYGKIDLLWYDLPQCYSPDQWRAVDLNHRVRTLQPGILINNRAMTTEDFATPEQGVHPSPPGRMWECCMTLNGHWGYCPHDRQWKSPRQVALTLASVASGGGNLLLNVGPDPDGVVPPASQRILRGVGRWLQRHGRAIYDSQRHPLAWYLFGPTTVSGHTLYLHLRVYYGNTLTVGGLTRRVRSASILSTGRRLRVSQRGRQAILTGLPDTDPDPVLTVLQLELDGPPDHDLSRVLHGADIFPALPA